MDHKLFGLLSALHSLGPRCSAPTREMLKETGFILARLKELKEETYAYLNTIEDAITHINANS